MPSRARQSFPPQRPGRKRPTGSVRYSRNGDGVGAQVLVVLTIARTYAGFAPAGDYAGTVSLVDPRIERVDIPLAVSMAYPVWQLPLVLLLLVLPLAIGYLWILKGSFHARRGSRTRHRHGATV